MKRHFLNGLLLLCLAPLAFSVSVPPPAKIVLDAQHPERSYGDFFRGQFPVGYGRDGFSEAGSRFRGGVSLLGDFRVNAILSADRFEMTPELIAQSGKTEAWLREHLFSNMSAIDFDGDGEGGEYGAGFISLEPIGDTPQPFAFGEYNGVFRWYSYAIHGTQDESRIGQKITGGCINVGAEDLAELLKSVSLGYRVTISKSR